jgi:hypothetical protein
MNDCQKKRTALSECFRKGRSKSLSVGDAFEKAKRTLPMPQSTTIRQAA